MRTPRPAGSQSVTEQHPYAPLHPLAFGHEEAARASKKKMREDTDRELAACHDLPRLSKGGLTGLAGQSTLKAPRRGGCPPPR